MRKHLRFLVLFLMLITSMTAGTLAVYTSRIDLAPVPISAKRFVLDVNQGGQDEFDLRIGPGEMVSYQFAVTNETTGGAVSEVDMDLMISADLSSIIDAIPGMDITLSMQTGSEYTTVASVGASGVLSFSSYSIFRASQASEISFSLRFFWNDDALSSGMIDADAIVLPLTIYVKGVQHVS